MTELTPNMRNAMDTSARDAHQESALAAQPSQSNIQQIINTHASNDANTPALHETVYTCVAHYLASLGDNADSVNNLYAFCLNQVEPSLIKAALEHCNHNQSQTAQLLGINRGTLRKKCKQYDLCPDASEK